MTAPTMLISNLKMIRRGAFVASFDVEITGWRLKVCGLKWMQKAGGPDWISLPQREWAGKQGAKRYEDVLAFTDQDVAARFYAAALQAAQAAAGEDPNPMGVA